MKSLSEQLFKSFKDWKIDRSPDYIEETLESAGCTGGCELFKDGLPNCEKCSQFKKKKK
ncbi:MAG: hypothetical protein ACTSPI_02335 [Candidatus Heimdallarchaeaceae archaeon]